MKYFESLQNAEIRLFFSDTLFIPEHDVVEANDEKIETHEEVGNGEVHDEERVHLIVFAHHAARQDDEEITERPENCDQPHCSPQNAVAEKVLHRRDAVALRLAHSHVRGIAAHEEVVKISEKGY